MVRPVRQAAARRKPTDSPKAGWRRALAAPLLPFLIPPAVIALQLAMIALFRNAFADHPGPAARAAAFLAAYSPALCLVGICAAATHFKDGRRLVPITGIVLNLGYLVVWGLFLAKAGQT